MFLTIKPSVNFAAPAELAVSNRICLKWKLEIYFAVANNFFFLVKLLIIFRSYKKVSK